MLSIESRYSSPVAAAWLAREYSVQGPVGALAPGGHRLPYFVRGIRAAAIG